jgi:hypothetical protein
MWSSVGSGEPETTWREALLLFSLEMLALNLRRLIPSKPSPTPVSASFVHTLQGLLPRSVPWQLGGIFGKKRGDFLSEGGPFDLGRQVVAAWLSRSASRLTCKAPAREGNSDRTRDHRRISL